MEWKTIDFRFLWRGENSPTDDIVLILIDEESRERFGDAPYPREIFARLITGLRKCQPQTIGIDFRFEGAQDSVSDNLFSNAMTSSGNIVTGCYFREIYEIDNSQQDEIRLLQAEEAPPVWNKLISAGVRIGHLNVLVNEHTGYIAEIPLFIRVQDSLWSSFPLEIIFVYLSMDRSDVKLDKGYVILLPGGREPIRIPIQGNCQYFINYAGSENVFKNCYSLQDVYDAFIGSGTPDEATKSIFRDKIVLIGSLVDEDQFTNPFSFEFPGILIHATVIDNILTQRFLHSYHGPFALIMLILGCVLYVIYWKFNLAQKIAAAVILMVVYFAISLISFNFADLLLPVSSPIIFIIIGSFALGIFDYVYTSQRNITLNHQVRQMDRLIKSLTNGDSDNLQSTFFRLIILFIEERDQCIFPNWLEYREQKLNRMAPFQHRLSAKNPLRVNLNALRKLNYDIERIWQIYYDYIKSNEISEYSPVSLMKRVGRRIKEIYGLRQTFDKLFSESSFDHPLNLVLGSYNVPWQLAYDAGGNRFLCELYSIGISFISEKDVIQRIRPAEQISPQQRSAVLFYGDWKGHPGKELTTAAHYISKIDDLLNKNSCDTELVYQDVRIFLDTLRALGDGDRELRLIHYFGHAMGDYLDVGDHDYLKPGLITESLGLKFPSQPLVFLNACNSGKLPSRLHIYDHLSTEFLAAGAGACIVTNFDVFHNSAAAFESYFYQLYVEKKYTAGEALRNTIKAMGNRDFQRNYDPEFDITRFAYCLFGDPTIKF